MPNDITSDIAFVGLHAVIEQLVKENLRFSSFFPDVPELDALDKLFPSGYAHMLERTTNAVVFRVVTQLKAPLDVLNAMTMLFPGLYIRCLWRDIGGREGLWVTTEDGPREFQWFGHCIEAYHMDENVFRVRPIKSTRINPFDTKVANGQTEATYHLSGPSDSNLSW